MQAKTLTPQELNHAISSAAQCTRWGLRNRMLLLITHWSGMRVCEVANLRISHVLDVRGDIVNEVQLNASQTKGSHSRVVVLPQRLQAELRAYIKKQFGLKSLAGVAYEFGHKPLFYTQKRNAFTPNTLTQTFAAIYREAGIKGATSHSGRRTWLTQLAAKGANVRVLQSLAGHRSLAVTQRYIEVNDNLRRTVAEMI
jgi:integrase/recombinase XerD